jgi:hypothetical protein
MASVHRIRSSPPTMQAQPKPSTSTLVISLPPHSCGCVGLGVLPVGVRLASRRRFGWTSRGGSRIRRRMRFWCTGHCATQCK